MRPKKRPNHNPDGMPDYRPTTVETYVYTKNNGLVPQAMDVAPTRNSASGLEFKIVYAELIKELDTYGTTTTLPDLHKTISKTHTALYRTNLRNIMAFSANEQEIWKITDEVVAAEVSDHVATFTATMASTTGDIGDKLEIVCASTSGSTSGAAANAYNYPVVVSSNDNGATFVEDGGKFYIACKFPGTYKINVYNVFDDSSQIDFEVTVKEKARTII